MENNNFRGIPTSLFLNGPKLGIVTDPQDQQDVIGVATFTGIATASFPDSNFDLDGGSIAFKWYFDGSQILDTSEDNNSNAEIVGFSSATGTGSTISISGLTNDDNAKEVYFTAEYVASAYSQPAGSAVTAGTARSTGNAFNEPLQSASGVINIKPFIEITKQPESDIVGRTFPATYSIAARTTPGNGAVNYQWQLNGNDLSDGTTTTTVNTAATGQIQVTNNVDSTTEVIDFSQISSYDNFETERTYTLVANANITAKLFAVGGGGGGSDVRSIAGSGGGAAEGTFTFVKDQEYKLVVGSRGRVVIGGVPGGGTGGGTRGNSGRGGGGGYTGLFLGSIAHANAIIIAGGGGGSTGDPGYGGAGGGAEGNAGSNGGRAGLGGTQSAGGQGKGNSESGSALQGGNGRNAGAGGGGYYGGGGGNPSGTISDGAGGGGSGYLDPSLITDGTNTTNGASKVAVDGSFRIELVSSSKEVTTTITGAGTENLSITTDNEGTSGVIRCKITADNVQESPIFSRSVSYYVVDIRNVLNIEQYNYSQGTATLSEYNLSDGSLSLSYDSHPGNAICLYAPEKDIAVEIDLYGGKGTERIPDSTTTIGGEGGYSKIRFTMKQNEEYILTGLFSAVNAPFLYRKATLIAVVGEGGDAGYNSEKGGFGGGINLGGQGGGGARGGAGAVAVAAGTLPSAGLFGSLTKLEAVDPDQNWEDVFGTANPTAGGRTIPCTRGVYWREQGKTPCEDLGTIKFRTPDGTEISNTAEIERGYKSGYNIIQTKGERAEASVGNLHSGQGGTGATGGSGGSSNGGGGGGSGYTDGSVTVVKTTQGGSTGPARINISLSAGNFFIDDQGRILIFSTNENSDPRNLTKTTGIVNYGDNACIDDARWQRFLDLARDGTQDYRLTATENNSTTKITNATEKNIHKMMNANQIPLRTSLTDWYDTNYSYQLLVLAWDETTGATITGSDYSLLSWSPTTAYGYGFYGSSSNSFFNPTVYGYKNGVDLWILPPGVPDF